MIEPGASPSEEGPIEELTVAQVRLSAPVSTHFVQNVASSGELAAFFRFKACGPRSKCQNVLMGAMAGQNQTDGRTLRRTRNREAVLDAVLEIFEEGTLDPSIDDVAIRAGVSNRSIYRYFTDRDHLIRTAMSHAMARVGPDLMLEPQNNGDLASRVERFVDHRLALYDRTSSIIRAAKLASATEPLIAEQFDMSRLMLRQQFLNHFGPELGPLPDGAQKRAVIAAELPFQFESFEFLTASTNGMRDEMRALLVDQLMMSLGRFHVNAA